uniref:Inositol polyphosphate-related phosphatase domain-containing protein n=1 Tax=Parascaris equorum TaxID=6256 RepID=A0A914R1F6_PAREQ
MAMRTRSLASRVVASLSTEHSGPSQQLGYSGKLAELIDKSFQSRAKARKVIRTAIPDRMKSLWKRMRSLTSHTHMTLLVCRLTGGFYLSALVVGPGGVTIPPVNRLKNLVPSGTIEILCLTWNVDSKVRYNIAFLSQSNLTRVCRLLSEGHPADRADVLSVCFQELPMTNTIAAPEWQFISSTTIVKPMRTKGAIAVYFRLFQASILLITCHLSRMRFVHFPDVVFWFGDLNFRLKSRKRVDALSAQQMTENLSLKSFFSDLLVDDELTVEKCKVSMEEALRWSLLYLLSGNVFVEFDEAHISFPPTHKFIAGSNDYVCSRIPSYTVRVCVHFFPLW